MNFSIKIIALYCPVFVSLIWGITLYFKNYKTKKPGYYMSFVEFSALAIFISLTPFYHKNFILSSQLNMLFYGGLLSIFPFVYFYIRNIATKEKIELKKFFHHLLPAFVFIIIGLFIPFILSPEDLKIYALNLTVNKEIKSAVFFFQITDKFSKFVLIIQSIFYLYQISILIKEFNNRLRNYFSNIENKYFNWIHIFYIIFLISLIASIPTLIAGNNYMIKGDNNLLTISFFTLSVVFYFIAFIADNHRYIADDDFYNIDDINIIENNNIDIQKKLAYKIKDYFEQEKPYLKKDLKITEVANALATNRTYVSDAIKNIFNSNFNKFVNSYRIEEAKNIFNTEESINLTTTEICEIVGFNTYSSFTKVFKKKYKCTPAAYRKKLKSY